MQSHYHRKDKSWVKPFMGGTYFPPKDNYGRPGFKSVLLRVAEAWEKDSRSTMASSDAVLKQLRQELFCDMNRGTEQVSAQTRKVIEYLKLKALELPPLSDVDRPEDLISLRTDSRFADVFTEQNKYRNSALQP